MPDHRAVAQDLRVALAHAALAGLACLCLALPAAARGRHVGPAHGPARDASMDPMRGVLRFLHARPVRGSLRHPPRRRRVMLAGLPGHRSWRSRPWMSAPRSRSAASYAGYPGCDPYGCDGYDILPFPYYPPYAGYAAYPVLPYPYGAWGY